MKTDDAVLARRVKASWRARACAAAIAVGAQIFAAGTGILEPMALNALWLAAIPGALLSVLFALGARKALGASLLRNAPCGAMRRAILLLLALLMIGCCVTQLAALSSLSQQSLLPQAQTVFAMLCALLAAALCALSGGAGVCRLAFVLRFALPLLLLVLTAFSLPGEACAGLFPLLGSGIGPLMLAALCGLFAASPALMLLLPPPELSPEQLAACPLPGKRFFLLRAGLGALCGVLLLLALSLCSTYETMEGMTVWGERMRLVSAGSPREGLVQTALVLMQTAALLTGASALLSAAAQALGMALPMQQSHHAALGVCLALCGAALWGLIVFGLDPLFVAAPFLIIPAAAVMLCAEIQARREARRAP